MTVHDLINKSFEACNKINEFSNTVLRAPGGRIGSGMGMLIEALWCYFMNQTLNDSPYEIGWIPTHQYNDFVCLRKGTEWNFDTREGELCRIEVKSMNLDADESKAHFDALAKELDINDLLLVIVWKWNKIDIRSFVPTIAGHLIVNAKDIVYLRDALHLQRGGSFVNTDDRYDGEPLNAAGKRERITGPPYARPSEKVSYAANFGGLLRMIKTRSSESRGEFRKIRRESDAAHAYISFIYKFYPEEEKNQYTKQEWTRIAQHYCIDVNGLSTDSIIESIRRHEDYQEIMRML
jgi:hypothetical protein